MSESAPLQIYLIPNPTLPELRSIQASAKNQLLQLAVNDLKKKPTELIIRDILPSTDLGYTNEVWTKTYSSSNTYVDLVTDKEFTNKEMVIYGVLNNSAKPLSTLLRVKIGADIRAIANLTPMYNNAEQALGILSKPILFRTDTKFTISVYPKETGTEELVLLGYIIEKIGDTISAPTVMRA